MVGPPKMEHPSERTNSAELPWPSYDGRTIHGRNGIGSSSNLDQRRTDRRPTVHWSEEERNIAQSVLKSMEDEEILARRQIYSQAEKGMAMAQALQEQDYTRSVNACCHMIRKKPVPAATDNSSNYSVNGQTFSSNSADFVQARRHSDISQTTLMGSSGLRTMSRLSEGQVNHNDISRSNSLHFKKNHHTTGSNSHQDNYPISKPGSGMRGEIKQEPGPSYYNNFAKDGAKNRVTNSSGSTQGSADSPIDLDTLPSPKHRSEFSTIKTESSASSRSGAPRTAEETLAFQKLKSLIETTEAERRALVAEVNQHKRKAQEEILAAQQKEVLIVKKREMIQNLKQALTHTG